MSYTGRWRMSRASVWQHKKYKNRVFKGTYKFVEFTGEHTPKGRFEFERVFILVEVREDKRSPRIVSLESWQQAKKQGWVKVL